VIKLRVSRAVSAAAGIFMLTLGSSGAQAQSFASSAMAFGATVASTLARPAVAATTAVRLGNGSVVQAQPAQSVTMSLSPNVATEAAWLRNAGWPLYALVDRFGTGATLSEEENCIAVAVYHEARGESLEGQVAVARVIMNRAASGKYPSSWCATVKQPWQFSFVNPRNGQFPYTDLQSAAWRKAVGVTRLAVANAVESVPTDCLWYHADYVSPSWGRRLNRVSQIGTHIFYRS
jgi:spore germination cell wall hydrolase CwlJ-like protein